MKTKEQRKAELKAVQDKILTAVKMLLHRQKN